MKKAATNKWINKANEPRTRIKITCNPSLSLFPRLQVTILTADISTALPPSTIVSANAAVVEGDDNVGLAAVRLMTTPFSTFKTKRAILEAQGPRGKKTLQYKF